MLPGHQTWALSTRATELENCQFGCIVDGRMCAYTAADTAFFLCPHSFAIKVRRLVIVFSLVEIVLTSFMAFSKVPPGKSMIHLCSRWLDTFTNLGVTVPALLPRARTGAVVINFFTEFVKLAKQIYE
eukprot:scaffold92313_cov20-Tisochrysis_lutea.AAC.1